MTFYPRINEAENPDDITLPTGQGMKELIGTNSGVKTSENQILKAGGKEYDSPITWEFIQRKVRKNDKIGELLENYVIYQLVEQGEDIDYSEVEEAFDKNVEDFSIKDLPEIGLTFGDFWDYRINQYSENPSIVSQKFRKTKKRARKEKEAIKIEIPQELYTYFEKYGKKSGLEDFRESIPHTSEYKGEIEKLFDFMKRLIQSEEKESVSIPTFGDLESIALTGKSKQKFTSEMIDYISAYKNVHELNDDEVYEDFITKQDATASFLNVVYNIKTKNVEKGQAFLAYCIKEATVTSTTGYYDILEDDGEVYNVKNFQNKGTEDNPKNIEIDAREYIMNFDLWNNIKNTISVAKEIENLFEGESLRDVLSDYFYSVWNDLTSNGVSSSVEKGKLSNKDLLTLKLWYHLAEKLDVNDLNVEEEEKYTMAVLKGTGVQSKNIAIEPLDPNKIDTTEEINVAASGDLNDVINRLNAVKYVKSPSKFTEDLREIINMYFIDKHESDYLLIFRPDEINIPQENDFSILSLSNTKIEIVENEYIQDDENSRIKYENFKKDIEDAKEKAESDEEEALRNVTKVISQKDFYNSQSVNESIVYNLYPKLM